VARTRSEALLLGEWACLGVLAQSPAHGFAVAKRLAPEGDIGRIWSMSRALTYRALDQLERRGMIERRGEAPGTAGGPRRILAPTPNGRRALRRWLREPVKHLRDVRAELLLKLQLCADLGVDPAPLVRAQRAAFAPVFAALASERRAARRDPVDPVAAWRFESSRAVERFLSGLAP
jgi:DNA-binding PadR family transcriptional regulator